MAVLEISSMYPTPELFNELMAMYHKKLREWPVDVEEIEVPTRYGSTHINACGPKEASPLFLIHAMGVTSTMWQPNVAELSRNFRVYATDTIGDQGKSRLADAKKYPKTGKAYADWLMDIFDYLCIEKAYIVGASMGGWIAMNLAIYAPVKVKGLMLLGPMGLRNNFKVLFRLFSLLWHPTETKQRNLIEWTLGENPTVRREFTEYMFKATQCRGRMATPVKLSAARLLRITAPTLLCLGEDDRVIGAPKSVIKRASRFISRCSADVLDKTGHLMNVEKPDYINQRIIDFFDD